MSSFHPDDRKLHGAAVFARAGISTRQWNTLRKHVPGVDSYYSIKPKLPLLAPQSQFVVVDRVRHVAVPMRAFLVHDLASNSKLRDTDTKCLVRTKPHVATQQIV